MTVRLNFLGYWSGLVNTDKSKFVVLLTDSNNRSTAPVYNSCFSRSYLLKCVRIFVASIIGVYECGKIHLPVLVPLLKPIGTMGRCGSPTVNAFVTV